MNGVVVLPGETYSYNNNIGDTTASKGYQAAATFKGGTTRTKTLTYDVYSVI